MGFFSRIKNVMKANANAALESVEDPVKLYDLKLKELMESLASLEKEMATMIANEKASGMEIAHQESIIEDLDKAAKKAAKAGNRDRVQKIINEKAAQLSILDTHKYTHDTLAKNVELMKANHEKLSKRIKELTMKRSVIKSKMVAAEAQTRVNEIMAVIADTNEGSATAVTDFADKKLLAAQAEAELQRMRMDDTTVDDILTEASEINVDDEVDKLMAKYGKVDDDE